MVFQNMAGARSSGRPDEYSDYVLLATLDGPDEEPTEPVSQGSEKTAKPPSFEPLRRFARRSKRVFDSNTGLLLISISQGFTSLMGVFVKKLNQLDPPGPVHPLEVSRFGRCVVLRFSLCAFVSSYGSVWS